MEAEEYQTIYDLELTHWWYTGMRDISLALLAPHLPRQGGHGGPPLREDRAGLSVLDAGCGAGGMLLSLGRLGRAAGIDFSPLALALSRRRGLKRIAQASVTSLPFRDGAFDLVTCFDVLYHLNVADDRDALWEFHRVLRPGGLLLLRLPAFEWLRSSHDAMVHTRHRYTAGELRSKLETAGFEIVRLTYANTLLFPVAAVSRLWQRLRGHAAAAESDVRPASPLVNGALLLLLQAEAAALRTIDLPVGVSVFCLARGRR
ncbi:MAG: class I SAM-dependent methyltransferase [Dehalococcoidia bacterium]|nr:class I SAM-dependent methyltransferase [Dehalococcoidia bacterium]